MKKIIFLVLITFVLNTVLAEETNIPQEPESWISDYANVLSDTEKAVLIDSLSALELRSSNQIYIAIFNNLPQNFYLEDFAVKLYEKWQPGLEEQDNGILIVIFIQDRKIRIEVGYGLEDVITDVQASALIREQLAPEFVNGNYFQGLKSVLDILIPAVEGKYIIPVKEESDTKIPFKTIIVVLIILFFISRFLGGNKPTGIGSKKRGNYGSSPFILGGLGGLASGSSSTGNIGGGFSGGFGGLSGGGGASGSW